MGALSLPKPRHQNQYGRDPESPSERLRVKTNYQKGTGYAPLFHAMIADLPRVSRGASCTHLILAVLGLQDRTTKDGWTPSLSLEDWADLAKCDAKEVQRNRDYLKARKMADCKVDTKRLYSFRLKPETWEALEDYKSWQAKQLSAESDDEPETDDLAQNDETKPGNWRMSKPVTVARGKRSKPVTPDCGVARIVFATPADTPDGVDIAYFGMVKAGDLIITPTVTLVNGVQKAKSGERKEVKSVPEDMGVLGGTRKRGEKIGESGTVDHPRAGELIRLFDPILANSAARLLSGDLPSLLKACEAVQDCDHDYLVKFAIQRAERPVKSPLHVPAICSEALASWKAARTLDLAGAKQYNRAEIDALIKAERVELGRKRAEMRRRK